MSHVHSAPSMSSRLRVNLFWLGKQAMSPGRRYKLKLATAEREVVIDKIHRVLDASDLDASTSKDRVERHDVADLVLRTRHPVAFDRSGEIASTSRFVIVDGYDIAGGGIVRDIPAEGDDDGAGWRGDQGPELEWVRGDVELAERAAAAGHQASLVLFSGDLGTGKHLIARHLERALVASGHRAYLLDGKNPFRGTPGAVEQSEAVSRYVEIAEIMLDAGTLVISTNNVVGLADPAEIAARLAPHPALIVHLGAVAPPGAALRLDANTDPAVAVPKIIDALRARGLLRVA
jgi:bifunctional enzyme CysN/CysC